MISKSTAKFIKSLQIKKHRTAERMFIVEGEKSVLEVINSDFQVERVVGTEQFIQHHQFSDLETDVVAQSNLESMGTFKSNNAGLAVVKMKEDTSKVSVNSGVTLALYNINDPGNLGAIIRIADWYGINNIVASMDTTDFYNPKTISATKGSFCRVNFSYTDLSEVFENSSVPVYGAAMHGKNLHEVQFDKNAILLMGNEANGISNDLRQHITTEVTIPKFGGAESLNVAMATAIICDNMKRMV